MIKSITNFLIIFFIFQQLKSQISQIYQNGVNPFCDENLHLLCTNLSQDMHLLFTVCAVHKNTKVHELGMYTAPHVCAKDEVSEWVTLHRVEHGEQLKATR